MTHKGKVMRSILCANMKGGVGKTTTAVMLAWHWARQGVRVGLVDLDLNAPLSRLLGCWPQQGIGFLSLASETGRIPVEQVTVAGQQVPFLPAPGLECALDIELPRSFHWEALRQQMGVERLILDAPSGYFPMLSSVLRATDLLIAPTPLQASLRQATAHYLYRMARLGLRDGRHLKVSALPVQYSNHQASHQVGLKALARMMGEQRVAPPVHQDQRLQQLDWIEAPLPPRFSRGIRDYGAVVAYLDQRLNLN